MYMYAITTKNATVFGRGDNPIATWAWSKAVKDYDATKDRVDFHVIGIVDRIISKDDKEMELKIQLVAAPGFIYNTSKSIITKAVLDKEDKLETMSYSEGTKAYTRMAQGDLVVIPVRYNFESGVRKMYPIVAVFDRHSDTKVTSEEVLALMKSVYMEQFLVSSLFLRHKSGRFSTAKTPELYEKFLAERPSKGLRLDEADTAIKIQFQIAKEMAIPQEVLAAIAPKSLPFHADVERASKLAKDSCFVYYRPRNHETSNLMDKFVNEVHDYITQSPSAVAIEKETEEAKMKELIGDYDIIDGHVKVEDMYIPVEDLTIVEAFKGMSMVNVMLVGMSGYGKTSIPMAFAGKNSFPMVRINCATVRDPKEWFGYREARDGDTIFELSEFAQAVETPNSIIILDEFNRVEPWIANSLLPLMDKGSTKAHGVEITRAEGVMFFLTLNVGSKFSGTFFLDAALRNRASATLSVAALPKNLEVQVLKDRTEVSDLDAERIVNIMRDSRIRVYEEDVDVDVSTRSSLKVAALVDKGISISQAVRYVVINTIPVDNPIVKELVDIVQSS